MAENREIEFSAADFEEDRYSRLRLIPWWDQEKLAGACILVVGAGAIGNELIKNLALLGVGKILIVDMDKIEQTNLTRSVLFRAGDVGRYKAEVAAERAMELNPDVRAKAFAANIMEDIGLGLFSRVDAVLGGLDNREARLFLNQSCYKLGKTYIDGAIEALGGFARVFAPPGPCYECTMTEADWRMINQRKSCALLTHEQMAEGKIPTTPTSSSIIAGVQVQELLKILHSDRGLPTLAGKGYVFNGLTHDSFVVEYQRKEDCMSHDAYGPVRSMPWSVGSTRLLEVLEQAQRDLGPGAVVDFDRDIAAAAACACGHSQALFAPVRRLRAADLICPACGKTMAFDAFHTLAGQEDFLGKTLGEIGIPPLHILCGRKGMEERYYACTGDEEAVFSGLTGTAQQEENL